MKIGLISLLLGFLSYYVYKYRKIKKYWKDLEERGYLKIYICFDDGGYIKGYVTVAQFRNFQNSRELVVKPLNPEGGEQRIQREKVYYIRVM
jgi:hypothetical protein